MANFNLKFEEVNVPAEVKKLRELPLVMAKKPIQRTFRDAVIPLNKALRKNILFDTPNIPAERIIKTKNSKGPSILTGIYAGIYKLTSGRTGKEWDAYQILYWLNYGTLARRDPTHKFDNPRKPKSANWLGGIAPGRFIQKSWDQTKAVVIARAEKSMIDNIRKFLEKNKIDY